MYYMYGFWAGQALLSPVPDCQILQSLTFFHLSRVERLAVDQYTTQLPARIEKSPVYLTLLPMNSLRTLTLRVCLVVPFVRALDPEQNPYRAVLCPRLEELVLYITDEDLLSVSGLLEMAKQRA